MKIWPCLFSQLNYKAQNKFKISSRREGEGIGALLVKQIIKWPREHVLRFKQESLFIFTMFFTKTEQK